MTVRALTPVWPRRKCQPASGSPLEHRNVLGQTAVRAGHVLLKPRSKKLLQGFRDVCFSNLREPFQRSYSGNKRIVFAAVFLVSWIGCAAHQSLFVLEVESGV